MKWAQTRASDDQSRSADVPQREDLVWLATDPAGCQWIAQPHDIGTTWNLTRVSAWGEYLEGFVGFESAEKAMAHADRRAREA